MDDALPGSTPAPWISANLIPDQRRPLAVERPPRNQKLHRGGVVARTMPEALVPLMRPVDLLHVDLDAQPRPVGNGNHPVDDPERLARQPLSVLPYPVGVDRRD